MQDSLLKSFKNMGYCSIDKEIERINKEFYGYIFMACISQGLYLGTLL
jgi:hypothetical protein